MKTIHLLYNSMGNYFVTGGDWDTVSGCLFKRCVEEFDIINGKIAWKKGKNAH